LLFLFIHILNLLIKSEKIIRWLSKTLLHILFYLVLLISCLRSLILSKSWNLSLLKSLIIPLRLNKIIVVKILSIILSLIIIMKSHWYKLILILLKIYVVILWIYIVIRCILINKSKTTLLLVLIKILIDLDVVKSSKFIIRWVGILLIHLI
jgi:hypothetical protein